MMRHGRRGLGVYLAGYRAGAKHSVEVPDERTGWSSRRRNLSGPGCTLVGMGTGVTSQGLMPILIPRLDDPASASVDERDDHLMLLEAVRHALDVEWTATVAVSDESDDHDVMGYPSTVAYLMHRFRMSGSRARRYVGNARAALTARATFSAWKHRQISSDQAEMMFRAAERTPRRPVNVGPTPSATWPAASSKDPSLRSSVASGPPQRPCRRSSPCSLV